MNKNNIFEENVTLTAPVICDEVLFDKYSI